MAAQDPIPGSDLSPAHRKWCELVAIQGWKYAEATRECFSHLKPGSVWSKRLSATQKYQGPGVYGSLGG
jgi:hypothetical protein